MATITTTIREPKTFQQIQDQQNELGKNQTLESLNNNISKLIKAITDRDEKRETEQDRQLKMNQLELSKLQLRKAQLGLAKNEKYYSDYSRKWSEKNNFGTSIGLDKNTSGNIGAIGVSALTAGALNPVIVKNLLFPIMTPLMNVTKALATFPGILPILFRRASGKSSSAIASDPDRKLHGKLDQILGAIKDKTKSSKAKEEKEQSMLSKFLNALLLGAAGMFMASELLGGADGSIMNTLKTYGPLMIAGYALGGWKGALVAFGLQLASEVITSLFTETDETKKIQPTLIIEANEKLNSFLQGKVTIKENEFKAAVAGYALGGWKGALVAGGLVMAVTAWQKMTSETNPEEEPEEIKKDQAYNKINEWLGSKIFDNNDHFKFTLAGFMIAGPIGMLGAFAVGKVVGSETYKMINSYTDKKVGLQQTIESWKNSDPLGLGISGFTLGSMIGLAALGLVTAGPMGLIAGAVLGLVGGYAFNQWRDISKPNKLGYATKFNKKTGKNELINSKGEFMGSYSDIWSDVAKRNPNATYEQITALTDGEIGFMDASGEGLKHSKKDLSGLDIAKRIGLNGISSFKKWWDETGDPILTQAVTAIKDTFTKILDTEFETNNGTMKLKDIICAPFLVLKEGIETFFNKITSTITWMIYGIGNTLVTASEKIPLGLGAPLRSLGEGLVSMTGLKSNATRNQDLEDFENGMRTKSRIYYSDENSTVKDIKDYFESQGILTDEKVMKSWLGGAIKLVSTERTLDLEKAKEQGLTETQINLFNQLMKGEKKLKDVSREDRGVLADGMVKILNAQQKQIDEDAKKKKYLKEKTEEETNQIFIKTLKSLDETIKTGISVKLDVSKDGDESTSSSKENTGQGPYELNG